MERDRLRALLVVEPERLEAMRAHYRDVLGWDEAFHAPAPGGGLFASAYGASSVLIGTPGAFGILREEPTRAASVAVEVPDVEALRAVIARRAPGAPGPLGTIPMVDVSAERLAEAPGGGEGRAVRYFDVTDPCGHVVRFVGAAPG